MWASLQRKIRPKLRTFNLAIVPEGPQSCAAGLGYMA
jgi:hypothetical protein